MADGNPPPGRHPCQNLLHPPFLITSGFLPYCPSKGTHHSKLLPAGKYLKLTAQVPATELPDPEADNANPGDSLRQQVSNSNSFCLHFTNQVAHNAMLGKNLKLSFVLPAPKPFLPPGGKVDRLGSSHNASRTDPAWILAWIPIWIPALILATKIALTYSFL